MVTGEGVESLWSFPSQQQLLFTQWESALNRYALKDITHPQDPSPLKSFTGITQSSRLNAILHANML